MNNVDIFGDINFYLNLKTEMENLKKQVATNQSNISNNASYISQLKSSIESLNKNMNNAMNIIQSNKQMLSSLSPTVANNKSLIQQLSKSVSNISDNLKQLQSNVGNLNRYMKSFDAFVSNTTFKLKDIDNEIAKAKQDIKNNKSMISQINDTISNIKQSLDYDERDISSLFTDFQNLNKNVSALSKTLSTLNGNVNSLLNFKKSLTSSVALGKYSISYDSKKHKLESSVVQVPATVANITSYLGTSFQSLTSSLVSSLNSFASYIEGIVPNINKDASYAFQYPYCKNGKLNFKKVTSNYYDLILGNKDLNVASMLQSNVLAIQKITGAIQGFAPSFSNIYTNLNNIKTNITNITKKYGHLYNMKASLQSIENNIKGFGDPIIETFKNMKDNVASVKNATSSFINLRSKIDKLRDAAYQSMSFTGSDNYPFKTKSGIILFYDGFTKSSYSGNCASCLIRNMLQKAISHIRYAVNNNTILGNGADDLVGGLSILGFIPVYISAMISNQMNTSYFDALGYSTGNGVVYIGKVLNGDYAGQSVQLEFWDSKRKERWSGVEIINPIQEAYNDVHNEITKVYTSFYNAFLSLENTINNGYKTINNMFNMNSDGTYHDYFKNYNLTSPLYTIKETIKYISSVIAKMQSDLNINGYIDKINAELSKLQNLSQIKCGWW